MKRFLSLFIVLTLLLVGCSSKDESSTSTGTGDDQTQSQSKDPVKTEDSEKKDDETSKETEPETDYSVYPQAVITMHTGEKMTFALMPEYAPNTVNNFIELAESGFYNGLLFHRVIENFMIQGGDPLANGMGGPGYFIKGEFADNGFTQNTLSHKRGVLSMARSQQLDSAGSQFFICHADSTYLDGRYAGFGVLISGEETLDRIAMTPTDKSEVPKTPEQIKSIEIQRNGYELKEVEKIVEKDTKTVDAAIDAGLPFPIKTPIADIVKAWGEYNSYDYMLGGLFYKYDEKNTLFFSNGYTTDNGVELGNVLGVAFFGKASFLDVEIGSDFNTVKNMFGEPTVIRSPENNQDSELYGGGWTLTYETQKYVLTFSSFSDNQVVDSIYVFNK